MALKYKELDHMIGVKQITKCQTCANFITYSREVLHITVQV
jgi:hypothetical protein